MKIIRMKQILDLVEDHLGVDATESSLGGALDGGVDGEGGQIPVWKKYLFSNFEMIS